MSALDRTVADKPRDCIERTVEELCAAKERRIVRRAIRLWRRVEADQALARLEAQPDRVH